MRNKLWFYGAAPEAQPRLSRAERLQAGWDARRRGELAEVSHGESSRFRLSPSNRFIGFHQWLNKPHEADLGGLARLLESREEKSVDER